MSFKKKKIILIISCLLNIAGIWTALAVQIRHDEVQTRKAAETNIFNLARIFEEHVTGSVKDIDQLLLKLRSEYNKGFANFKEETRLIKKLGYDNPLIRTHLINREGILIYTDQDSPLTSLDNDNRKQFIESLDNENDSLLFSRPVSDKRANKWKLQFSRKLYQNDGSFSGAIIASVQPSLFSDFFQSIDIGSKGAITLFGTDGYLLAHVSGVKNIETVPDLKVAEDHPFISKKVQNGIYSSKSAIDGVLRLSAYRKLQSYPLLVQVGISEEDIYRNVTIRKKSILIIGVLITVALFGALAIFLWFEREQQKLLDILSRRDEHLQVTLTELEHLVTTDSLTGLPNRRSFFSKAQVEFTRSSRYDRPLALVMIDVDHFKEVNDQHGHLVGDAALRHIAEIMGGCIRGSDMVARYGGEEFVIILPETGTEGASYIAERVRSEIAVSTFQIDPSRELKLTVSMGIACMSAESQYPDLDKLLQEADDAMYRAKAGGRNCIMLTTSSKLKEDSQYPN